MRVTWLLVVGGLLSLLCAGALTLFPMHPEKVESQAAAWLSYVGFSEWAEGVTKTTDSWVSGGLWILLAVAIGLLCVALIRAFRRDQDAEEVNRNPGNGWRVSRLIMKVRSLRTVEALCRDFMAQPHKTEEAFVIAAATIRRYRTKRNTPDAAWDLAEELEEERMRLGSDVIDRAVSAIEKDFPVSWWARLWRGRPERTAPKPVHIQLGRVSLGPMTATVKVQMISRPQWWRNPVKWVLWNVTKSNRYLIRTG